ncbi:MAG: 4-(cytidine 5'-diphospho)-2-C-methyl-D-erythritol kinase [Candidatus Eisenbacteria bacterium]|nr:4-(cytidine 5'-diphospho)-2-C-methyl-D-erythritol kinase [Candidatus Eisenbacteria bacterium]
MTTMQPDGALTVEAYAKLNLGLAVGRERDDGYHEIATIFQSISLSDTLRLSAASGDSDELVVRGAPVPTGADNLILRALARLRAQTAFAPVRTELTKRIPVAAGLGGGSSDAAAALVGVVALHGLSLGQETLGKAALDVGSDVPFFLSGGTMRGGGRGELLEPLPALTGVWFVLATPARAIRAGDAYARARIGLTDDEGFIRLICSGIRERDLPALAGALRNDLEPGVVSLCPSVSSLKQQLLASGAAGAAMSGSGPTVFGIFEKEESAKSAASRLRGRGHTVYVAEPIDVGYRISTQ